MAVSGAECVARADVIYVDDSATAGANTGQSWPDAFTDLQSALAIAQAGDEIRVGQGTYKPAPPGGSREATFNLVDATLMRGGYAGAGAVDPYLNDPDVFVTTLSGDLNSDDGPPPQFVNSGDNSFHVLTADGVGPATRLLGVTVTAGHAVATDPPHDRGGGLTCVNNGQPTLRDCDFRLNRTGQAGGAICAQQAALLIEGCEFTGNRALMWSSSSRGAAIACGGPTVIDGCVFSDNTAFDDAGGVFGPAVLLRSTFSGNHGDDGGAVTSTLLAAGCDFIGNSASFWGGAAYEVSALINCRFVANTAESGGAVREVAVAVNCLFSGNSAWLVGGAATLTSSAGSVAFANCTFSGNRAYDSIFGGVTSSAPSVVVRNCVFWGNHGNGKGSTQSRQFAATPATATIGHTIMQGWDGSLAASATPAMIPLFIDADGPDDIYGTLDDNPRLSPISPARDSGDNQSLPVDEFDLDHDGDVAESLPIDLDGRRRLVNSVVDRGCYEYQTCLADFAPADTQGDGIVDALDLLAVIQAWGSCGVGCAADLNHDGVVGIDDLLAVISAWGPCG